jgi:hypothetical protein
LIRAAAFSSLRRVSTFIHGMVLLGLAVAFDAQARPSVPVGIDYETPLRKGAWKFSYRYQHIRGGDTRDGTKLPSGVTQVPVALDSDLHTFGIQHAFFERLTLALQLPLVSQRMRQRVDGTNDAYTTRSFGVGDLELIGLIPFMEKDDETLNLHVGLRLPTAEVGHKGEGRDAGGGKPRDHLPVAMQSGSGTFSVIAGLSYQGYWRGLGWGVHGTGDLGFGDNRRGYRLGNGMAFDGWLGHDVTSWLSGSLRLAYDQWHGLRQRPLSGPDNHPASYRSATGGERLALAPGLSIGFPGLCNQRLSVEASWPVYQSLRGVRVERDWSLTTGWEWTF